MLHSWGQNLSLHPHIHCLVPAAGYTLDGKWKNIGHSGTYLYPVHQLSVAFKAKFLDSLKRILRKQNQWLLFPDALQQAYKSKWVVYCEPSLAGADLKGLPDRPAGVVQHRFIAGFCIPLILATGHYSIASKNCFAVNTGNFDFLKSFKFLVIITSCSFSIAVKY